MKHGKRPAVRRREKATRTPAERQMGKGNEGAESLLKEVAEANANVTNPEERERVIPSRPC